MKKKGKKYVQALELIEKNKAYTKEEAIELVKKTSTTKFDGSVEVAINLNLDTKKTDQQLRGAIVLPNGTGKTKKVLVLTKNAEQAKAAKEAEADFVGEADLVDKIQNILDKTDDKNKKLKMEAKILIYNLNYVKKEKTEENKNKKRKLVRF